jgi:hypothetical protein
MGAVLGGEGGKKLLDGASRVLVQLGVDVRRRVLRCSSHVGFAGLLNEVLLLGLDLGR